MHDDTMIKFEYNTKETVDLLQIWRLPFRFL